LVFTVSCQFDTTSAVSTLYAPQTDGREDDFGSGSTSTENGTLPDSRQPETNQPGELDDRAGTSGVSVSPWVAGTAGAGAGGQAGGTFGSSGRDAGGAGSDSSGAGAVAVAGQAGTSIGGAPAAGAGGIDVSGSNGGQSGAAGASASVQDFAALIDRLAGVITPEQQTRFLRAFATDSLTPALLTELFDAVRTAHACDGASEACQAMCQQVLAACSMCNRNSDMRMELITMCATL
jgi:hypothetical protein